MVDLLCEFSPLSMCKICIFHVSGLIFASLLKGADSSADIMH